jgi:hypothetical protein
MGTQFTSRLTKLDRQRILVEIQSARESVSPAGGKRAPVPLTKQQARIYGQATVRGVLGVANARGFLTLFDQSPLFEEVLSWLKSLWNDAYHGGFKGHINKYGLEDVPSPVPTLNGKLKEIIDKHPTDPFRVPVSNAAKAILVKGVTTAKPGETQAQAYGRKLATLHVRDIVSRYINRFIHEALSQVISRADPESASGLVEEAITVSAEEAERLAKKIVNRIKDEGKLCNVKRTHEIVIEELGKIIGP